MLKSVLVRFANPEFNYETSVNFWASDKSLRDYFVNQSFCVTSYPVEEFETCIDIKIIRPWVKVIAGSFTGEQGMLKAGLNKELFTVNGCLVTRNQIEVIN